MTTAAIVLLQRDGAYLVYRKFSVKFNHSLELLKLRCWRCLMYVLTLIDFDIVLLSHTVTETEYTYT